jgi:folylpolyglutamate synthase/dihydropteroate synthase
MLTSILHSSAIKTASFTSPHLIEERDSIRIGDKVVSQEEYQQARNKAKEANKTVGCSPFELLTATAFLVFSRLGVQVAVVEVGLIDL